MFDDCCTRGMFDCNQSQCVCLLVDMRIVTRVSRDCCAVSGADDKTRVREVTRVWRSRGGEVASCDARWCRASRGGVVRREVDVANSRWTSSGLGRSLRVVRVVVVPYSLLALGR